MLKTLKRLWANRPKAKLMRECLQLSESIKQNVQKLECRLKEKGILKDK